MALLTGALAVAVTVGSALLAHKLGPDARAGDLWALRIADIVAYTALSVFLFGALTYAADAAIDSEGLEPGEALLDAWDRRGPLLAWGLIYAGVLCVFQIVATSNAAAIIVALFLVNLAWSLLTFFAIPALTLDADRVGPALAESARAFGSRWRQTVSGLLRISFATFLAAIPAGFVFGLGAGQAEDQQRRGAELTWALAGLGLGAAVISLASATAIAFALVLYRDSLDELPTVEPAPRDRMRLRRRVAVVTATVFGLLVVAFVIAGLADDERGGARSTESREASDPGYYLVTFEPGLEPSVEDGMPILLQGRTVGHVAEHRVEDGRLIVVCWVQRQYRSLARHAEFGTGAVDPRTGVPALGMRPDRESR